MHSLSRLLALPNKTFDLLVLLLLLTQSEQKFEINTKVNLFKTINLLVLILYVYLNQIITIHMT